MTLSAYVDQTLSDTDARAVETHLSTCAACRQEVTEISGTVNLLRGLPVFQPRRSFHLDPAAARRERGYVVLLRPYFAALPALRVATAAVALLFLGTIAADILTEPQPPRRSEAPIEQAQPATVRDQPAAVATATSPTMAARDRGAEGIADEAADAEVAEPSANDELETSEEADTAAQSVANDEPRPASADRETSLRQAPAAAPAAPTATPAPTETPVPTATPAPTVTPTPVPEQSSSSFAEDFPWLMAEIFLGGLLVILASVYVALRRLRRRLDGPAGRRRP